jgi:hypothetical protein
MLPALPLSMVPALPVSALPAFSLSLSGLQAPQLAPQFSVAVPPALQDGFEKLKVGVVAAAPAADVALVRAAGASEAFVAEVQAQLESSLLPAMISDIIKYGYVIQVKDHITQDRPDLDPEFDFTGGLNDWGPLGTFVMIAERIKSIKTGEWMQSGVWRNAVVHECGHAVDHVMAATDSQEFRDAWAEDYRNMPEAVKGPQLSDGGKNAFYYFLRPSQDGGLDRARQETWAEGFDVLMRGEASSFNYANFQAHFPRTLAAMRRLLAARYGSVGV